MTSPDPKRLLEIVNRFPGCSLIVVGDLILDQFVWGKVDRISPEAPVPIVDVQRESLHLGGAANVAANLAQLGAQPLLLGVVGEDWAAERLRGMMQRLGLTEQGLISDRHLTTTVKTRIIAHHQQVCRTDRESRRAPAPGVADQLRNCFDHWLPTVGGLILSDYAKGVLFPPAAAYFVEEARRLDRLVAVDPKSLDFSIYGKATILTPNQKETFSALGAPVGGEEALLDTGRRLLQRYALENLLVTRGKEGMVLFEPQGEIVIPTMAREVFDVTGAGDTVTATLALAVLAGASLQEAAYLANCAAGVVVGKLGTAAVTAAELMESLPS